MTNAELITKIKSEIERRKKSLRAGICNEEVFTRRQRNEMLVASEELDRLNRFLSTLESEKPMNQDEDLEEEIERIVKCEKEFMNFKFKSQLIAYIARHFAEWGAERLADARKTSPKDLEEAKEAYCEEHNDECFDACGSKCPHIRNAYIAGAKWQKEEDDKELSDLLTIAHLQGAEQMKEMMMKEAVEGEVCIPNVWVEHKEGKELVVRAEISKELGFKFGDKVRIIIVKEN